MEAKSTNQSPRQPDDTSVRPPRAAPAFNPAFDGQGLEQVRDTNC
jgi:hypothetical protein